jgi:hypothetical protein
MLISSLFRSSQKAAHSGGALAEYGIIGITLVTVCAAGFLLTGKNLDLVFGHLKDDTQKSIDVAKTAEQKAKDAAATFKSNLAATALQTSASGSGTLCSSEWCISAPGLTGNYVETSGSNGSSMINLTNSAAGIFAQMAAILQAQGADASLINLLTNLANQGHDLANYQNGLFNGAGDYGTMSSNINGMRDGLSSFKSMSSQLDSLMSQVPADARGILMDASNVIIAIGDSYSLSGTGNGDEVGWGWHSINVQLTHTNSNTICSNGGDTDVCIQ